MSPNWELFGTYVIFAQIFCVLKFETALSVSQTNLYLNNISYLELVLEFFFLDYFAQNFSVISIIERAWSLSLSSHYLNNVSWHYQVSATVGQAMWPYIASAGHNMKCIDFYITLKKT